MTLPDWVTNPDLAPVWSRVRGRLERTGLASSGRLRVDLPDRSQRHAVGALIGRPVTRTWVNVDLAELDHRLRERSGVGGLVEVLTVLDGEQPRDRRAERLASQAGREAPLALARELVSAPWAEDWVMGLRRTGLLTNRPYADRVVTDAARVLLELTDSGRSTAMASRVELAARLLGDSHALDEDRLVHQVVLRGLAAATDTSVPVSAAARRGLWERFGVQPDLVSRTCLTWRLLPGSDDPRHLTAWNLRRSLSLAHLSGRGVLVCENPRVLEAVAETGSDTSVVCTSGEPNTVVTAVLALLANAGATLRYHGDFDWPGIAIANRLMARFDVTPWQMSEADYTAGFRADAPRLSGTPVEPSWDPELFGAMRSLGRALHEESVLPQLLAGL